MGIIGILLTAIACLLIGGISVWVTTRYLLKQRAQLIIKEAEKEAEVIKKEKLFEVKEKGIQMKAEVEKQANARYSKIQQAEAKIKQRELQLNQKNEDLSRKKQETEAVRDNLDKQLDLVELKKGELDKLHKDAVVKLEQIAGLSADEAKEKIGRASCRERVLRLV